ncbi:hypothetical protein [Moritella yayanosii]|uniref:Uncharacterized protein n=1 Tax=Moritella yayanosii TaxID=69539 RepID=A0A330LMJ4_9GAMM|nr:hypothetical protein [Moritella yayanosii]SQD77859.1 conserved protein of unknown function [Moritella yayanosii]
MKIKAKSVRSMSKVVKIVGDKQHIRLAISINDLSKDTLLKLGFNSDLNIGDSLMPTAIGKFSDFNANGKEVVRKDLPKESCSIMCYGTTRDWQGNMHSGIQTRTIKKYPRDYIVAPSEIIQVIKINDLEYIATDEINLTSENEERNIHLCNLMLECFSEFEIFDIRENEIVGPKLKRLQWDVLPKGKYPWSVSGKIIQGITGKLPKNEQEVIDHRMKAISRHNPDFLASGRGGFSGYFVYGFESKGKYVLESIHLDNATYVFESDWEDVSQLTKNEIINSNIVHERVVHNKMWANVLARAIK